MAHFSKGWTCRREIVVNPTIPCDFASVDWRFQQETQRASKYERMFQDSSAAGKRLIEDLEKAKADARKTAQEVRETACSQLSS